MTTSTPDEDSTFSAVRKSEKDEYLHRILSGGKQLFTLSLPGAPFEESFQCQFEALP